MPVVWNNLINSSFFEVRKRIRCSERGSSICVQHNITGTARSRLFNGRSDGAIGTCDNSGIRTSKHELADLVSSTKHPTPGDCHFGSHLAIFWHNRVNNTELKVSPAVDSTHNRTSVGLNHNITRVRFTCSHHNLDRIIRCTLQRLYRYTCKRDGLDCLTTTEQTCSTNGNFSTVLAARRFNIVNVTRVKVLKAIFKHNKGASVSNDSHISNSNALTWINLDGDLSVALFHNTSIGTTQQDLCYSLRASEQVGAINHHDTANLTRGWSHCSDFTRIDVRPAILLDDGSTSIRSEKHVTSSSSSICSHSHRDKQVRLGRDHSINSSKHHRHNFGTVGTEGRPVDAHFSTFLSRRRLDHQDGTFVLERPTVGQRNSSTSISNQRYVANGCIGLVCNHRNGCFVVAFNECFHLNTCKRHRHNGRSVRHKS